MLLLLPEEGTDLNQAIAGMQDNFFEEIDQQLCTVGMTSLDIYLPKFKIETEAYDLIGPCQKAGVKDLFSQAKANLRGMIEAQLFISVLLHKAVIEVDEEGATGAAVTLGIVEITAWRPPEEIRFNRSFLAIVRDRSKVPVAFATVHKPQVG